MVPFDFAQGDTVTSRNILSALKPRRYGGSHTGPTRDVPSL
jgi:hypothetical protein